MDPKKRRGKAEEARWFLKDIMNLEQIASETGIDIEFYKSSNKLDQIKKTLYNISGNKKDGMVTVVIAPLPPPPPVTVVQVGLAPAP